MQILATGRIVWTNMVMGKLPQFSTAAEHMFLTNQAIQNIPEAGTLCVAQLVHQNASPGCREECMDKYGHRKITAAQHSCETHVPNK